MMPNQKNIETELAAVTAERDEAREQWRMSSVCRELRAENDTLKKGIKTIFAFINREMKMTEDDPRAAKLKEELGI